LTNTVTAFSRFFTIQITKVTQQVNESGSRYTVSAIPFHHLAYADSFDTVKKDVKLTGGNVGEVLSSGPDSFMKWLNDYEQSRVKEGAQSLPDVFEIVFPADESDQIGALISSSTPFSLGATVNPLASVQKVISNAKDQISSNFGSNAISSSTMNFSAEVGGNYVRQKDSEVIDTTTGTTDRSKIKIDPNSREYISNVLGAKPKGKNTKIWVEAVYPDLIKKLDADGFAYGVNSTLIQATSNSFTNYREQFKTPETPWVVS
jgi:hypothetical protein